MKKVFYSPVENASAPWKYAGLFLRTLVTYTGILGLCALICGAAGLSTSDWWGAAVVKAGHIALLSLPAAVACGVACTGRISAAITPFVYTGAYAAVISALYGNPLDFTVKSALRIYNMALYRMTSMGYASIGNYMIADGYDYSQAGNAVSDPYRFGGAFLLATLLGVFLYFTVQKKVRVIPLAAGIAVILAPILTYNIAKGNAGIGFTVCFICGALGMKIYDRAYSGRLELRQKKREERKLLRDAAKEERKRRRDEKAELYARADGVFEAAAESEMGIKKAKAARRAVLSAHKEAAKKAKAQEKQRRKAEKKAEKKKSPDKEARKAERKRRRFVSYMGGYAGVGTLAVVFLALWIPMATVSGNFRIIEPINNKVQIVRTYVTAYLKGNDVDLNELYAYGIDDLAPRKLTFEPLSYRDRRLFRVESETDNNIYLRSWIGTDFDYEAEEWTSADTDTVLAYRETFGNDFSPDEITHNYYKYVYPSSTYIEDDNVYKNFLKYGFSVQKVNVWRVSGKSLLLFVPAHMNTDIGLTEYGSMGEPEYKYSRYFDGVYSSRFYKYGSGYGTVSYVSAFNRADSGDGLDNSVRYWLLSKEYILDSIEKELSQEDIDALLYDFDTEAKDQGIEYMGVSLPERYFTQMTQEEKAELIAAFELEESYRQYALESYTEKSGSPVVSAVAEQIREDALQNDDDGNLTENELAMAVVDYFRNNYRFTLTPDGSKYTGDKTVLEAFLTDVKEGYCTHFATAAAAILREYGLPVRYAEGLTAHEFSEVRTAASPYRSYVEDNDASAWIEVYTEGMGWVQYEVTPGELCEGMYDAKSATLTEEDLENNGEKEDDGSRFGPDEKHETALEILNRLGLLVEREPGESDLQWFLRRSVPFLIILAVFSIIFLVLRYFYRKAHKALGERYSVIEKVQNPANEKNPNVDYKGLVGKINEMILEVFELIGEGPEKGELPREFAERIARDFSDLSNIDPREIFALMEKAEFGHGIGFEEADRCAEYLKDITNNLYGKLKFHQKIKLRYIKRKL